MIASSDIKTDFNKSAPKTRKRKAGKRPAPVSIRFNQGQLDDLEERAAGEALSTYIKAVLFSGKKHKSPSIIKDYQKMALALGLLGQLGTLESLDNLVDASNEERVTMPKDVQNEVIQTCSDIRFIRQYLILGLGIKEQS